MDDLRTILDNLDDLAESYVWERSKNLNASVGDILEAMDVGKSTFYKAFPADRRNELDEIARRIFRNSQFRALRHMDSVAEKAARRLEHLLMNASSEYVQLQAAQTILSYAVGTPTQRIDVTSGGNAMKLYAEVSPDDWDD